MYWRPSDFNGRHWVFVVNELPFGAVYLCGTDYWNVLVNRRSDLAKFGFGSAELAGQYLKEQIRL
jgi:hypothetical protein